MGFTCKIYPDEHLGVARAEGRLSGRDVLDAVRQLFDDPAWNPTYRQLWDARDVRGLAMSPTEARDVAAYLRSIVERIRPTKAALITPNETYRAIGMLLAVTGGADPSRVKLFSTLPPALDWLEVSERAVEALLEEDAAH